jgi:hypothetical protein
VTRRTNGMAPRAINILSGVATVIVGVGNEGVCNGASELAVTIETGGQQIWCRAYELIEPTSAPSLIGSWVCYGQEVTEHACPVRGYACQVTAQQTNAGGFATIPSVSHRFSDGPRSVGSLTRGAQLSGGAIKEGIARLIGNMQVPVGAFAQFGGIVCVHDFARIWAHIAYAQNAAPQVFNFRFETSAASPGGDPAAIADWQPVPIELGPVVPTATGGQIAVYGEEGQLLPTLALATVNFPVIVEGANWLRLMAYEVAAVGNGVANVTWTGVSP